MLWALIMAGGSGTRFWPESRAQKPKQFLTLFGKKTLLEQTLERLAGVIPSTRMVVITNESYTAQVRSLSKLDPSRIIGEPVGRNTAPCAALGAALAFEKDKDAIVALLPADHRIGKPDVFKMALKAAAAATQETGEPVTFGVKPTFPHTGYGYLEMGGQIMTHGGVPVYRLKQFHEKPDLKKAAKFVKSGKFLWNSGMFVWRADRLLEATRQFQPEIYKRVQKIIHSNLKAAMKKEYPAMPNISIDYGLMEKLSGKILTLPVDMDWRDLGGWNAFAELWPADLRGNILHGQTVLHDASGNIVKSDPNKVIALLGVHDLVIVDTPDALLVCPKDKTESIRDIIAALKTKKLERYL